MSKLFQLVSNFTEYLISEQKAIYGIKVLKTTIEKVRENPEQVCGSLHKEFAKLCIKTKCYQHALPIIEQPVTSFRKNTSPIDILSYLYYKALILIALKKYQNAIDCLKVVISYPSNCTHKVHTESYKKLILLSLIEEGRFPVLPKYTAQMLKIKLENAFANYKALANSYIAKEDTMFQQIIQTNYEEFEKDKNVGLIKKLTKLYSRVRVCDLSNTYLTLRYRQYSIYIFKSIR